MSPTQHLITTALIVVAYALAPVEARGDDFRLANGGSIRGTLVERDRSAADDYVIESDAGITLTLSATAVERVVPQLPANEEYEALRDAAADTVEGQWELAQWCLDQSLSRHRRVHLERIIEIEPDHAGARRALEYFSRDGRWVTRKEANTKRGLVRYKAKWMTPQKARILKDQEALREQEGEWHRRISRYAAALAKGRGGEQAAQRIRQIDDPVAVVAIEKQLLSNPRPSHARLRLLALEPLATIGTPAAQQLLAGVALYDPEEELRLTATEYFQNINSPDVVEFFVSKLRADDVQTINRAASVLAALGDDSAVGSLIDVLVIHRRRKVTQGSPGGLGATFGNGGSGLSAGSSTTIVNEYIANADVYDALRTLTGADFGERNVAAWKQWHASRRRTSIIDARSD